MRGARPGIQRIEEDRRSGPARPVAPTSDRDFHGPAIAEEQHIAGGDLVEGHRLFGLPGDEGLKGKQVDELPQRAR